MQFLNQPAVPKSVTPEEIDLPELTRDLDRIKSAVFIGRNAAFLGSLMSSLTFLWSYEVETAATNGEFFWWNPNDFLALPRQERGSTVEHELWHVARMHMVRRGNRDPRLWNIACDIRINRDLRKDGHIINPPMWIPDIPECPYEVEEDIYDWLVAKQEEMQGGNGPQGKGGSAQNPNGDPLAGLLSDGNSQGHMLPMPEGGAQLILGNVVKAMQTAKMANQAGNIPGDIEGMINKFLSPVIPWHRLLFRHFTDLHQEENTWRRPNRRYTEMYMPSRMPDSDRLEHLAYYYDVSGSITDKQKVRISSELKYIKDHFNPLKLTIVEFDTRISKVIEVTSDEAFDSIKIVGGGGTCLKPVREHILKTRPSAAVIFSDLEVVPMEPVPAKIPIFWIKVGKDGHTPTFGKVFQVDDV